MNATLLSSLPRSLFAALAFTVAGSGFAATSPTAPAVAELAYSGNQDAVTDLDRAVTAAGTDSAKLQALQQQWLALLRRTDLTFAGRQAIAQHLGAVLALSADKLSADSLKPLPAMLLDERDSDLARLALDQAPGDAIDAILVTALGKSTGRPRLGLLDTLARRRVAAAVPELKKLVADASLDAVTLNAAIRALGQIATPEAMAVLETAPASAASAVTLAQLAAAPRLTGAAGAELANRLARDAKTPAQRAAAFRLSLELEPATAVDRVTNVLGGSDWTLKQVALESLFASRASNLASTLTSRLANWDAPTQAAVIHALVRRGEASATPALVTATTHADAEVRAAAITGLGQLPGSRDIVTTLAQIAAGSDATDAKLARQSLARLNGPDVSAAILAGAERGESLRRTVLLEQLALRNMTEGLPLLSKLRADPDVAVRTAAVAALGDLAPASEQKSLLDWAIEARDTTEQTRALRSYVAATLRQPATEERGRALFTLLESARPELALRLMPALARIGGASSAAAAAKLAQRDDAKLAEAAANALARWPDATALPALSTVAEKAAVPEARAIALEAAVRSFERNREVWTAETTAIVARLLTATKEDESRKKLVALLHRAADKDAMALAEGLKTDPVVGTEASVAADVIRANLAGKPKVRASNDSGAGNILDGKTSTRWTTPALGEEWIEVDFRVSRPVRQLTLDQTGRAAEFPEHYDVFVCDDPKQPGKPAASGSGQRNQTVIKLPANTRGRYVIIRNTAERKDTPWSVCELFID